MPFEHEYGNCTPKNNPPFVEYEEFDWSTFPRKHRACGVYVFDMVGTPFCKVGSTGMPVERFRAVSTYTPFEVTFPYFLSPDGSKSHVQIELAAQAALAEFLHSGEWFECDKDIAIRAIRGCAT